MDAVAVDAEEITALLVPVLAADRDPDPDPADAEAEVAAAATASGRRRDG